MRGRSTAIAMALVAMFCVSACGGGTNRSPAAPSTALSVAQGAGTTGANIGVSSVSWSCFTRASETAGAFGSSGCPAASVTTPRFQVASGAPATAPSAPTSLSATVSGSTVTLNWSAPVGGDAPTSYIVQAGSAPGLNNLASFDTGSTATTLVVLNVPAGTYFVHIRGNNAAGSNGASNEFLVVVTAVGGCVAAPNAPTNLTGSISGSTLTLTWNPSTGTCPAASYLVQGGSSSGATNVGSASVVGTSLTAVGLGNGTYYIRVYGVNAAGQSGTSNEIVITIGPVAPPPTLFAQFQFFDPGTQAAATDTCRITSNLPNNPSTCEARSTSFALGTNSIVSYEWTVQYFYGTAKTITQSGSAPTVSFSDTCGGPGSTDDGVAQPVVVTLTVTDNLGAKATATSGTGSQPPLRLRLFKC